ncbi:hypothetical protein EVAR_95208_1 [Eumeta japonica]|uniref:Uncharacterized protein n=1 Tax=Eumeta variegata TaxID=151549 RepID=A0A4C1VHW4_EUMVA|nr:hypothetical protein EVAR_95208_1 [Eumeta japonica]
MRRTVRLVAACIQNCEIVDSGCDPFSTLAPPLRLQDTSLYVSSEKAYNKCTSMMTNTRLYCDVVMNNTPNSKIRNNHKQRIES